MFKREFQQLQIFPEEKKTREQERIPNFKTLLFSYERKLRFFIIFIISLLIVYSVGVEKGKKTVQVKKEKELTPVKIEEIKPLPFKKEEIHPILVHKPQPSTQRNDKVETKAYIIQIATYKKGPYAEKEMLNLKKKGFSSFIRKSRDFIVVYVGNFQSKNEAQISLKKLKKHYSDCFIRKL